MEIDFDAIAQQARDYVEGNANTGDNASQTPPTAALQQGETNQPAQTGTQAPATSDDGFELEVDPGKKMRFTREQLVDFYKNGLRQQDYTKKTQELATHRKQMEQVARAYQQLTTERQQVVEFLRNPALVQQYLQQYFGQGGDGKPVDPNAPVTLKDVEMQQQYLAKQMQDELVKREQAQLSSFEQRQREALEQIEAARYAEVINPYVKKIFEDNPVLSLVDNMEDVIRFKVFQMQPSNVEEAKAAFAKVAQEQVERINAHYQKAQGSQTVEQIAQQKAAATVNKSKLDNGIDPKGGKTPGAVVAGKKAPRTKEGDIDWNAIAKAAEEFMRNQA